MASSSRHPSNGPAIDLSYSGVFATPSRLTGRGKRRRKRQEPVLASPSDTRVPHPPSTLRPFADGRGFGKRPDRTTRVAYIPWVVPARSAKRKVQEARKEALSRRNQKSKRTRGHKVSSRTEPCDSAIGTIIPIYSTASEIIESAEIDINVSQADRRPFSILRLLTQDWLSFLEDEKNDYNSFALCAEVKLKEALRLTANVERPNLFMSALSCNLHARDLLHMP